MAESKLILIAAVARNGVVGNGGGIPWKPYKGDLKRFRELTVEHAVIMGRKTAEELEQKGIFPLPDRYNIIVSGSKDYNGVWPNAESVKTLDRALFTAYTHTKNSTVWVIGGGELYRQTIERATSLEITEIPLEPVGDSCFPQIPPQFREVSRTLQPQGHSYVQYEK